MTYYVVTVEAEGSPIPWIQLRMEADSEDHAREMMADFLAASTYSPPDTTRVITVKLARD